MAVVGQVSSKWTNLNPDLQPKRRALGKYVLSERRESQGVESAWQKTPMNLQANHHRILELKRYPPCLTQKNNCLNTCGLESGIDTMTKTARRKRTTTTKNGMKWRGPWVPQRKITVMKKHVEFKNCSTGHHPLRVGRPHPNSKHPWICRQNLQRDNVFS